MKLGKCAVTNFGSYRSLEFDFSNQGLALIYGPTGSGKSTLQDIPAWILFGVTAKDGNSDEIKSWQGNGEATTGAIEISTPSGNIVVTRIRGSGKSDLYWTDGSQKYPPIRGKDLADTQKLLSARLGVDSDSYLTAAYFHEFSPHSSFFTAKAKERRDLFDRLTDLSLPSSIGLRSGEARKIAGRELENHQSRYQKQSGKLEQLTQSLRKLRHDQERLSVNIQRDFNVFETKKNQKIDALLEEIQTLETKVVPKLSYKAGLRDIEESLSGLSDERCPTCNSPRCSEKKAELLQLMAHYKAKMNEQDMILLRLSNKKIALGDLVQQKNPHGLSDTTSFAAQIKDMECEETALTTEIDIMSREIEQSKAKMSSLEQLSDLSSELRGALLQQTVSDIETSTNSYLDTYFDAELRVKFTVGGDKLEVAITKNGYGCVYTQLSKGQRQLLKFSFAVSVMSAAANKAGIHLDCLMFDEALDGFDTELKVKAFRLFEDLNTRHSSVLVIDHAPELQALFQRKYRVALESDQSQVHCDE